MVDQKIFIEMCQEALDHWDFEAADEPYRSSKIGLERLIESPLSDEQLAEIQEEDNLLDESGNFDWDWLQELAVSMSGG